MVKKKYYVFLDRFIGLMVGLFMMIYGIYYGFRENYLFLIAILLSAPYFLQESKTGVLFIMDILKGPEEQEVRFSKTWDTDPRKLEEFSKIKYIDVYFEGDKSKNGYMLFYEDIPEKKKRGDVFRVKYYPRTRIIVEIERVGREFTC